MPVKIYTDESVPVPIAAGLKRRGVVAISAREAGNLGLSDEAQFAYARTHRLLLFTHDTDFLQLAHQYRESNVEHWGVIYIHQNRMTLGECIRRLKEISELFEQHDFKNYIGFL